jgi:translation initiation factor IF-2
MIEIQEYTTTKKIGHVMNVKPANIIKEFMKVGMFVTIDQRLDAETIEFITGVFNFKCKITPDITVIRSEQSLERFLKEFHGRKFI